MFYLCEFLFELLDLAVLKYFLSPWKLLFIKPTLLCSLYLELFFYPYLELLF